MQMNARITSWEEERERQEAAAAEWEQRATDWDTERQGLESAAKDQSDALKAANTQLEDLQSKLAEAERAAAAQEAQVASLREELTAAQAANSELAAKHEAAAKVASQWWGDQRARMSHRGYDVLLLAVPPSPGCTR